MTLILRTLPMASLTLFAAIASPSATVSYNISLTSASRAISPLIYGCEENKLPGAKFRRIGGNRLSAYNWENNASNAGADWGPNTSDYYLLGQAGLPQDAEQGPGRYIKERIKQFRADGGIAELVTIQAAGYVSADGYGIVSSDEVAPSRRWKKVLPKKGRKFTLKPDLKDDFVYMDEQVWSFQQTFGTAASGGVKYYCIDNEPDLWKSTHALVHPAALTYPESVALTTATAKAILDQDPDAEIFGLVSWGYGGFKYLSWAPDHASHNAGFQGWFAGWYLDQMNKMSRADGRRLIHYLDVHWYPEAQGQDAGGKWVRCINNDTSPGVSMARMQAPRSLWDPSFTERSWIQDDLRAPVMILPRLRALIDLYYPGTKLAITEYNFGDLNHVSVGIAMVDGLGVLGELSDAACYFGSTHAFTQSALALYLDHDGEGGSYGDQACWAKASDLWLSSVHAARFSKDPNKLSVVSVNKDEKNAIASTFELALPPGTKVAGVKAWRFGQDGPTIQRVADPIGIRDSGFTDTQPALSATIYMVELARDPEAKEGRGSQEP